jgi:hypothetical protein
LSKSCGVLEGQERYESQSVKIHGDAPVLAHGLKIVSGFIGGCPSHDDVAVFVHGCTLLPDHFPYTPGDVANVHACAYFQQPDRQSSAQARWHVFGYDHCHRHVTDSGDLHLQELGAQGWQVARFPAAGLAERFHRRPELLRSSESALPADWSGGTCRDTLTALHDLADVGSEPQS